MTSFWRCVAITAIAAAFLSPCCAETSSTAETATTASRSATVTSEPAVKVSPPPLRKGVAGVLPLKLRAVTSETATLENTSTSDYLTIKSGESRVFTYRNSTSTATLTLLRIQPHEQLRAEFRLVSPGVDQYISLVGEPVLERAEREGFHLKAANIVAWRAAQLIQRQIGGRLSMDTDLANQRVDLTIDTQDAARAIQALARALNARVEPEADGYAVETQQHYLAKSLRSEVVVTATDSKDFLQIITPTLGPGESARAVGPRQVAVTATSATLEKIQALTDEISKSLVHPPEGTSLRAVLLSSAPDVESSATTPLAGVKLQEVLGGLGVSPSDIRATPMPPQMYRIADLVVPVANTGENRVALTERYDLNYEVFHSPVGEYEVGVTLNERERGASPFATGNLGRIVMMNRFQTVPGKAVILGVSNGVRTTMLALTLAIEDGK